VVPYAAISSVRPFHTFDIVYIRPDGSGVVIGSTALALLKACTLLAEVAWAVVELLQPYLYKPTDQREGIRPTGS
jgi:hypothetical protein